MINDMKYIGEHGKPSIDKISIVLPNPNKVVEYYTGKTNLDDQFIKAAKLQSIVKADVKAAKYGKYNFALMLYPDDASSHGVFFQIGPKQPNKNPFMRLEFNPNKLGPHGLTALWSMLQLFMEGGGDYLWNHGKITRLDVAIDLHGVEVSQARFLHKWATTERTYAVNGELETIYWGRRTSDQTRIYNKVKENKLVSSVPITRVERKLKMQKPLIEMLHLKNPFGHFSISNPLPSKPANFDPNLWELFSDSVEKRGPASALKFLPKDQVKNVAKHLKENPSDFWKPDEFWHQWPEACWPIFDAFAPVSLLTAA